MRVKKHTTNNEYIRVGNTYIRNFTKQNLIPPQLTHMFEKEDYGLILKNTELNKNYPKISDEKVYFKNIVIISDGFSFNERHKLLGNLPKDVAIFAVNEVLKKWTLVTGYEGRLINAYIINNPYAESLTYLPKKHSKYYPTCIASIRTNYTFLKKYLGQIYTYIPTPEDKFGIS